MLAAILRFFRAAPRPEDAPLPPGFEHGRSYTAKVIVKDYANPRITRPYTLLDDEATLSYDRVRKCYVLASSIVIDDKPVFRVEHATYDGFRHLIRDQGLELIALDEMPGERAINFLNPLSFRL